MGGRHLRVLLPGLSQLCHVILTLLAPSAAQAEQGVPWAESKAHLSGASL